jgi:hypothetical protein
MSTQDSAIVNIFGFTKEKIIDSSFKEFFITDKTNPCLPLKFVPFKCGKHFGWNPQICFENNQSWGFQDFSPEKDFNVIFKCQRCNAEITKSFSACSIQNYHGWNNWIAQESGLMPN